MSLANSTIAALRAQLKAGEIQSTDIVDDLEKAISSIDSRVQGYLSIDFERARREAQSADLSLPLGGIPIAIKDVINVEGENCTCASQLLSANYRAPYDATAITKLRAAGAIPLGRTNMDEFAMGSSTENSSYQVTKNPWDLDRIPGGSSGGSAAVVAAHEAIAALGSDTGGSIRQPAALCGCVGLKPTYGRVSRYGLVAFASSLDQIGPFAKTVEDAALLLEAISGHDPQDSTSVDEAIAPYANQLDGDIRGLKIGVPKEYFVEGLHPGVEKSVREAIATLRSLGAEIVDISLPHTEYAVSVYYIIATAEASTNLARFDGVRYGARVDNPSDLLDLYTATRERGFGPEVKRRIILGTYVLSSGYYDAYYLRAQKARTLIRNDFLQAFEKVDAILSPTTPTPAFKIGEKTDDPLQMYLADIFTIATNLAGICGLSLPCGFVDENGSELPVGIQLMGKPFDEACILRIGHAYEQATTWHQRQPAVS